MTDELYEKQLNMVEDLLEFHPEFIDIFTADERKIFELYFCPNWDNVKDFHIYRLMLVQTDPAIEGKAQLLLRRFCVAHILPNDLV